MKLTLYRPTKKELKKVAFVTALSFGAITIAITTANAFFMKNYLSFQSPVVLRTPVLVHSREVVVIQINEPEIEVVEATESAKTLGTKEFSPSSRLVAHSAQRPDVYGKIKEYFGNDSMIAGELLSRESSLNPKAINPSSGACGLFQALPCGKMDCSLDDIDCQMEWGKDYIETRYGDVQTALEFHDRNGWY